MASGNYDGYLKFDTKVDTSGFQSALGKLGSTALKSVGAVAGTLSALGGAAIKQGIEFESAFAGIKKTVDATDEEFKKLESSILSMSERIPQSASDLAEIGEAAGQLGIKTENIDGFIETMANLGVATNMSSEEAANSLARLANITQMPRTEFNRLGSTIVALGNNLATTESEITEMGLRIAGAGNQVGMSEAQIMAFSGALSSVGIEAEAGGTAFSTLLSKMNLAVSKGGKDLQNFAKVAGQSASEFQKSFQTDASGAVLSFINGLSNISASGGSAIATLDEIGLSDVRMRDAMLRAAGASNVFTEALQIGETAWEENAALTKEAEQRYATMESRITLLKNSIQNLGIAFYQTTNEDIGQAVDILTGYVGRLQDAFAENGINGLVSELGNVFADLSVNIANAAPAIIDSAISLIQSFVSGIQSNLPSIVSSAIEIVESLLNGIASMIPQILQAGIDMIVTLGQGIVQSIPQLLPIAIDTILGYYEQLLDNIDLLVDAGIDMLFALAEGLIDALPAILDKAPVIIEKLVNAITNNLPKIMSVGMELIVKLVIGLIKAIPSLIKAIPQIIAAIVKGFFDLASNFVDIGKNIVKGIWEGISNFGSWIYGKIKEFCGNIVDKIKGFFGIHSPSRVMRDEVGKMIVEGIAVGIKENSEEVSKEFQKLLDDLDLQKEMGAISDAEYYKELERLRDQYLDKGTKDWWNYTQKIIEYEEKSLQEQKNAIVSAYTEIAQAAKAELSEIEQAQSKLADKMKAYGSLYTEWTTTIKGGGENGQDLVFTEYRLNDLSKDIEALEAYKNALLAVKERGAPDGFFEVLQDLGIDEGTQFANTLLGLSDEEFKKYLDDWNRKNEVADSISKEFYKDKTDETLKEIEDELAAWYGTIPEGFLTEGKLSAEKFGEGFMEQLDSVFKEMEEAVSMNVSRISPTLTFGGGGAAGGNTTYSTTNQTFTIGTSKNTTSEQIAQWQNATEVARLRGQA